MPLLYGTLKLPNMFDSPFRGSVRKAGPIVCLQRNAFDLELIEGYISQLLKEEYT